MLNIFYIWDATIEIISGIFFMYFFRQSVANRISKTGRSCLRINIYRSDAMWGRGPLTQLSARGISSAAVRLPFYYRLCSRPFFLILFPSCFLRLPSPPFFFHAVFRLSSLSVSSLRSTLRLFYRHSLSLRIPPIRPRLTPFTLRHRLCRLKIPSGSNCGKLQQTRLQTHPTNSYEPKMESGQRVNWLRWHDTLREIFNSLDVQSSLNKSYRLYGWQ